MHDSKMFSASVLLLLLFPLMFNCETSTVEECRDLCKTERDHETIWCIGIEEKDQDKCKNCMYVRNSFCN